RPIRQLSMANRRRGRAGRAPSINSTPKGKTTGKSGSLRNVGFRRVLPVPECRPERSLTLMSGVNRRGSATVRLTDGRYLVVLNCAAQGRRWKGGKLSFGSRHLVPEVFTLLDLAADEVVRAKIVFGHPPSSSMRAFASFRSAVSKPSV